MFSKSDCEGIDDMNVVRLIGGLGNQLFQYAFGRAQMLNWKEVSFDNSWNKRTLSRPYRLNKFNTQVKLHSLVKGNKVIDEREIPTKRHSSKGYNPTFLNMDDCNFCGYWQYLSYVTPVLGLLQKEIVVQEEFYTEEYHQWKQKILDCNQSVSIHVRRGDYVTKGNEKGFGAMPFRYYFTALSMLEGEVFVFSDDVEWCRARFKEDYFNRKISFIHLEDYLDFELMRFCQNNVISRSSFSWWAAMLNTNPEKKVVAPSRYIVRKPDKNNYDNKIHYPEEWIKV